MMRSTFRNIMIFVLSASLAEAETRIRIAGNHQKLEAQLLGLIGDRLTHVRDNPASTWRADDAAFLLTQVMRKDGYPDAQVSWKVVNRDEILLQVKEGVRFSLGSVTITGLPADETERMVRLYRAPAEKGRPIASGSAPFREVDVDAGLSNITQELNADGYWDAKAAVTSRETNPATGEVTVAIAVERGPLHRIGTPQFTASQGLNDSQAVVKPFIGRIAKTSNLNAMRLAVEEALSSSGYPEAKIEMRRTLEGPLFIPDFAVDLGRRVRLRSIHIEGLERTNPDRITQHLTYMEGDWYNEAAMNKHLRAFLATAAFSTARVETEDVGDERVDATLHFSEARAREISLAAGAGSYQGLIARVTYADRNLFGQLLGFSSGFEFSSRGVLGETKVTDPWLFGSDVSGMARVYALNYGREGYSTLETGLEGKITRKFGDHYTLDFLAAYSFANANSDKLPLRFLGETVYTRPRLRLTQTIDYRDSPVLPKSGWHLENPIEVGAAVGDTSTAYFQTGLTGGWYLKINRLYSLGIGGEVGVVVPSGDRTDLPIDLRLFNGGSRSVRSFPERELGPTSPNGYPIGGEAMWNSNVELTRMLGRTLAAVAFMDAGALSRESTGLTSAEIELAAGLGLKLELPIGPVRLEYGYNLTRDSDEPIGTLHFAIGFAY